MPPALGLASLAWPSLAVACSVCLSATSGERYAYYLTTALLGALPFAMVGGLALWLRKAARHTRCISAEYVPPAVPGERHAAGRPE